MSTVRFYCGRYGVVDLLFLQTSYRTGRLQGATAFAKLFDLENDEFVNKNQCNLEFEKWKINLHEWLLIISYIKNGYLKHCINMTTVEGMYNLANQLGGIPSLDDYYVTFFNQNTCDIYSPDIPESDYLNKYRWVVFPYYPNNEIHFVNMIVLHGWEIISSKRTDTRIIFRKKR